MIATELLQNMEGLIQAYEQYIRVPTFDILSAPDHPRLTVEVYVFEVSGYPQGSIFKWEIP